MDRQEETKVEAYQQEKEKIRKIRQRQEDLRNQAKQVVRLA